MTLALQTLDEMVASRTQLLVQYQDAAYAARYRSLVERVRAAEVKATGSEALLALSVARQFAKLMAYKDEYEVARLYSAPEFRRQLEAEFDGPTTLRFNLAPPLFARRDPVSGHLLKREFGAWMLTAMKWLAKAKHFRGTALDLFGRTAERRMERALIDAYEQRIDALLAALTVDSLPLAVQIADVPETIRGFGHVKEASVALARVRWAELEAQWRAPSEPNVDAVSLRRKA